MKIILITRMPKIGNIGDIVDVKSGYAKNFLIPQKKAIFYSDANYKIFEAKKQHFEAENQKFSSEAEKNKAKLVGKDVIIIENASDDGRLYGSVGTADIADQVNKTLGAKIVSRINILLKKPIKELGIYDVKVDLYSGIFADVKVIVTRSESEIENLRAAYNNNASEVKTKKAGKEKEEAKKEETQEDAAVAE